MKLTLPKIFTK